MLLCAVFLWNVPSVLLVQWCLQGDRCFCDECTFGDVYLCCMYIRSVAFIAAPESIYFLMNVPFDVFLLNVPV